MFKKELAGAPIAIASISLFLLLGATGCERSSPFERSNFVSTSGVRPGIVKHIAKASCGNQSLSDLSQSDLDSDSMLPVAHRMTAQLTTTQRTTLNKSC